MALDAAGEHDRAEAAYTWLARHQLADGSWYAAYHDGDADRPTDLARESNFCAYVAVGAWHHYLSTGDDAFIDRIWPTVRRAVEYVLTLQQPGGQIGWKREPDGTAVNDALLTGSSSVHQALRCALAIAEHREEPQPDWELATGALGHAIRRHPERFLDKSRYSMDWYYPVLSGALRGPRALATDRGGLVPVRRARTRRALRRPQPVGHRRRDRRTRPRALGDRASPTGPCDILADMQHLRADDGLYWTGYVFADDAFWPDRAHHVDRGGPSARRRGSRRRRAHHGGLRRGTASVRAAARLLLIPPGARPE